jgi:hypothetical protein
MIEQNAVDCQVRLTCDGCHLCGGPTVQHHCAVCGCANQSVNEHLWTRLYCMVLKPGMHDQADQGGNTGADQQVVGCRMCALALRLHSTPPGVISCTHTPTTSRCGPHAMLAGSCLQRCYGAVGMHSSGGCRPLARPPEPRHPERCAAQQHATGTTLATSPARSCRCGVPHARRSRPLQACIKDGVVDQLVDGVGCKGC